MKRFAKTAGSLALAVSMILSAVPAFAAEADDVVISQEIQDYDDDSVRGDFAPDLSDERAAAAYIEVMEENQRSVLSIDDIKAMSSEELEEYGLLPYVDDEDERSIAEDERSADVDYSYTVTSKNIQQVETYYCGPAAVLQALYASGTSYYNAVSGSSSTAKQQYLAATSSKLLYTDRDNGTWIEYMPTVMNKYASITSRSWTTGTVDKNNSTSKNNLTYYARSNFSYNRGMIYLVKPGSLSYYSGSPGGHYISGSGIYHATYSSTDYSNITMRLNDPHYSSSYYGTHIEPFNNLVAAMHDYTTSVGPANYVY